MIVIYDIETLKNFFCYVDLDYNTKEFRTFKIGLSNNDLLEFHDYLKDKKPNQVGYNNLKFDSQVCQYILENTDYWSSHDYTSSEIANEIHKYSQSVIDKQDSGEWSDYPEWKLTCKQLDLFKIWHFDNAAKRTSLKWIQFAIDWHDLRDMPINHNTEITEDDIESIIDYCKNDVSSTAEFLNITLGKTDLPLYKGKDKLQLRKDIKKEFGINCLNFNDVKIGDELNKIGYLNLTGLSKYDLKNLHTKQSPFTFKDCIPEYISFKTFELQSFYNKIKDTVVDVNKKQEFTFDFKGTSYTIAKGGIHSNDPSRIIKPTENQVLIDADIGSQYPNALRKRKLYPRHLGTEWLNMYIDTIEKRLDAKKEYKRTKDPKYKSIDELFKLALNGGGFGKTGESTSWQYDPFVSMNTTIGNQFEILMLIEELELQGIRVISANTDGIVSLFYRDLIDIYYKVCENWEIKVGNHKLGKLEYTEYELLVQNSVNSYLAVKKGDSPIETRAKYKSEFTIDFEINKNKSARVVNLALSEYFLKGINPKIFIENHRNIYDFCIGVKANKGWYFQTENIVNGELEVQKQQKTIRYYVSKPGKKLVKCHNDGRRIQAEAGIWMQTIFNLYQEKEWNEYNIDYKYYISRVYDIINKIDKTTTQKYTQLQLNFI